MESALGLLEENRGTIKQMLALVENMLGGLDEGQVEEVEEIEGGDSRRVCAGRLAKEKNPSYVEVDESDNSKDED